MKIITWSAAKAARIIIVSSWARQRIVIRALVLREKRWIRTRVPILKIHQTVVSGDRWMR